MDQDPTGYTV